jgi:hypothetical protein
MDALEMDYSSHDGEAGDAGAGDCWRWARWNFFLRASLSALCILFIIPLFLGDGPLSIVDDLRLPDAALFSLIFLISTDENSRNDAPVPFFADVCCWTPASGPKAAAVGAKLQSAGLELFFFNATAYSKRSSIHNTYITTQHRT